MEMGAAAQGLPDLEVLVRRVVRASLGAEPLRVEPIEGQLGRRRFARVVIEGGGPPTLVARVEAPEDPHGRPAGADPEPPLEPIRALLERRGLPVPARLGGDEAAGVELLEDLGSITLTELARRSSPEERRALYAEACDLVPRLQEIGDPGGEVAAFRRRLDRSQFLYKADLFATWSLPERGREATSAERSAVREAFELVADAAERAPQRLAHRDFQSANLLLREGGRHPAMIDLQGALLAPPEYDLVCLLRDSYVELPDDEVDLQWRRVRPHLPEAPDPESFARRFDLLTLSRKGKDHARFLYAARNRGDERFLAFVPASVRYLRAAATRAAARDARLAPLAELIHDLPETPCAR
jgi:aminoglycoside/choline kinase family phosphotransferase